MMVNFPHEQSEAFASYFEMVNGRSEVSAKDLLIRSVFNVKLYAFDLGVEAGEKYFLLFFDPVFLLPGIFLMLRFKWLFYFFAKKGLVKNIPEIEVRRVKDRVGAFYLIKGFEE